MATLKAKVTITGTRPLLFNRFTEDSIPLQKKERTGVAGNDPDEWKRSVLKTDKNQLYIDPTYIFGCIRDGGKHTKNGRSTLQPKVASTLLVLDDQVLLDRFLPKELSKDPTEAVYLDIRSVKNPVTKGRNIRYRIATSPGWKIAFQIQWEGTIVSRHQMEAVIKDAGSFAGLGDGRNIGFGRFNVDAFDIEDASAPKPAKITM